jgi:hypothetical protein
MTTKFLFKTFAFALILFSVSCKNNSKDGGSISTDVINVPSTASGKPAVPGSAPVMTFSEIKHDFGKITQGEKVSYSYVFTNTGGSDLVISTAHGSCGCTVPSFPKEPVKPGQSSKIDVVFDSSDKSGLVEKTVTVVTNCNPSTKVISFTATINIPDEDK